MAKYLQRLSARDRATRTKNVEEMKCFNSNSVSALVYAIVNHVFIRLLARHIHRGKNNL